MGQSANSRGTHAKPAESVPSLSIFPTNFGWFGLLGQAPRLAAIWVGHASADEVRQRARAFVAPGGQSAGLREADWDPELRRRLEAYCLGQPVEFDDVPLELPARTEFQARILECVRRVGYGRTISYGELAAKAGFPRAARAVGTVMSSNRFPIVVPCHRVIASSGKPGGYSSPQGISLKLKLLELEASAAPTSKGKRRPKTEALQARKNPGRTTPAKEKDRG